MKCARFVLAVAVVLFPLVSHAQDFGVVESAETIDKGNFKLRANPIVIFSDGDQDFGVAAAFGYGFNDRFDAEAKVAFYDGLTFIGGDGEFWLIKRPHPIDLSVSAGFHFANSAFFDQTGIDLTFNATHPITSRLDVYGALDMAFRRYRDSIPNDGYTQVHIVPGIEYKLHRDLDLVAEAGFAVNDNGHHYISGGVAYYLR
jgi:hypothetical protein